MVYSVRDDQANVAIFTFLFSLCILMREFIVGNKLVRIFSDPFQVLGLIIENLLLGIIIRKFNYLLPYMRFCA